MAMFKSLLIAALTVAGGVSGFNQGTDQAVITSVTPRYGSLAGGTLLTIEGTGFQRGNISGSTDVFIGAYRCDINQYHSDDNKIVCETRQDFRINSYSTNPMYKVQIARHSMTNVQYASCQTDCRYGYRYDRTPLVQYGSVTVESGGQLMFGGYLRGLKSQDYTIKIDGKLCNLREPYVYSDSDGNTVEQTAERRSRRQDGNTESTTSSNSETYNEENGATSEDERVVLTSHWGRATEYCTLPSDLQAGKYNYSVHVRPTSASLGWGEAQFSQTQVLADFQGSQHLLMVAPHIASVNTKVSGAAGGHTLVIDGTGFNNINCSANKVQASGGDCKVTWCNNTRIECIVPPKANATTTAPFPGSMGLEKKIWETTRCNDLTDNTFAGIGDPTNSSVHLGGLQGGSNLGSYYCQEMSGFFVPPVTANYSFWVRGDNAAKFEIDDGLVGLRSVAFTSKPTTSYLTSASQKSVPIPLNKGEKYPVRVRHLEHTGNDNLQVGVVVIDSVESYEHTDQYHRIGEKQKIIISNSPASQKQRLVFRNTTSGFLGYVKNAGQTYWIPLIEQNDMNTQNDFKSGAFNSRFAGLLNQHSGCNRVTVTSQLDVGAQILTVDLTFGDRQTCLPAVVDKEVVPFRTVLVDVDRLVSKSGDYIATHTSISLQNATLPVQGTYTLTIGDVTTEPIPYHTTSTTYNARRMIAALQIANNNVHGISYARSGYPQTYSTYTLSFRTPFGVDHPLISMNTSGLLGNRLTASAKEIQDGDAGGRLFDPIPDQFLEGSRLTGAVTLDVNGIKGVCDDDYSQNISTCGFTYDDALTPIVTEMRVKDNDDEPFKEDKEVVQGGRIWLKGTGFKPTELSVVTVTFGGAECKIEREQDYTDTKIQCRMNHTTKGEYYPEVVVSTVGKATFAEGVAKLFYGFVLKNVKPTRSGIRGGTRVTLTGTGFSLDKDANDVKFGGADCKVIETNFDAIVCIAPAYIPTDGSDLDDMEPQDTDPEVDIVVGFFNNETFKDKFEYQWGRTPYLTKITPTQWSSARTTTLTFFGKFNNKFTSSRNVTADGVETLNCTATVQFVSPSGLVRDCTQVTYHKRNITCILPRGEPFPVDEQDKVFPRVQLCAKLGKIPAMVVAHPAPAFSTVDIALRMSSVSPQTGSLAGGTNVTISGAGFVAAGERIQRSALTYNYDVPMTVVNVAMADRTVPCQVFASNFSTIECTTLLPSTLEKTLTAEVAHTYAAKGGNGFVTAAINDFTVPPCKPDFTSVNSSAASFKFVSGEWCSDDGDFCFAWANRVAAGFEGDDDGIIRIQMDGVGSDYIALGFAEEANTMAKADVAMCRVGSDGKVVIEDRYSKTTGVEPDVDVAQGLFLEEGSYENGRLSCTFLRKITAVDASQDMSLMPGGTNVIWSIKNKSDSSSMYHDARGTVVLDSFFEQTDDEDAPLVFQIPPHHEFNTSRAASVCNYDYVDTATPTLTKVGPDVGVGSVLVTLTGTKFGSNPSVMVGSHVCPIQTSQSSDTSIKCLVPKLPAGRYYFRVTVPGKGLAAHPDADTVSFVSSLVFDSTSPQVSAAAGGLIATIVGKGFNPRPTQNEVRVHGQRAHVQTATTERLVIVSPRQNQPIEADVSIKVHTDEIPNYYFGQTSPAVTVYSDGNVVLPASPPADSDQCAKENNVCKCTGTVYYGLGKKWFKQASEGTIQCDNSVFGDPLVGTGKVCTCVTHGTKYVAPAGADVFELPASYKVTANASCSDRDDNGARCKIAYLSPAQSPAISSITPTSGVKGTRVVVTGLRLAPELSFDKVDVNIGGADCPVVESQSNATHVVCDVATSVAGTHTVYVTVGAVGTATPTAAVSYTSLVQIEKLSVGSGSFAGGTELVLTGKGFAGGASERRQRRADNGWGGWFIWEDEDGVASNAELGSKIELCNTECTVTNTSYDELRCVTNPLNSLTALLTYKTLEPEVLQPKSFSQKTVGNLFDNNFATNNGWSGTEAGFDLGEDAKALITRIRFFPYHQQAHTMKDGKFEVSADNSYWMPLAWVRDPHQGWNYVTLDPTEHIPFRYFRFKSAGGVSKITELMVYGYEVTTTNKCNVTVVSTKPMSHPSLGPMKTDHSALSSTTTDSVFAFAEEKTGVVNSIEPKFGSSLGGTTITLSGENLPTSTATAQVTVNGQPCTVIKASTEGDAVECVTGSRGYIQDMKPLGLDVRNTASGMGSAMSNLSTRFRYLDRWSEVTTWLNDEPPIDGDTVIVPEDQTLLLDVQPPKLFVLLVHGMMVFDRMDLNLDAHYILVQGGLLEIGTEEDPFLNKTTITLHGDRRKSVELPFVGAKMLAVADKGGFTTASNGRGADVPLSQKGILDIHGQPRLRTWTKCAEGVIAAGTRTIETAEPTDFAKGEIVVLTAPHQQLTVDERISPTKFTVVENITNAHESEIRRHVGEGGDFTLDMRCEVALISRNIVVQGAGGPRLDGTPTIEEGDDEEASTSQLYGVHTGTFHGGFYRVENSEFRHCGQAGVEGRYCLHFHVTDDNPAPNSYIKSNSIHHSFQRATTIHKTHHALVQNNVAYHVMGHTYFIEDGDEMYNTFDGNIGIFTRPSHMALKSDTGPATFWTAIPDNYWRNNVAVDSTNRGAWFELTHQGETLEFRNNSFHHNAGIGFRNYPNYSPPSPQYFYNNSYFRNGGNGLFYKKGGDNHHVFSKFAENGVDIFWTKYSTHETSRLIPNVHDCVFWGGRGAQAIFAPQHEFFYVNGSTFIGYEDTGVLSGCAGCCKATTPRQGGYTVRFERTWWINSTQRTKWTCPYKQIFYDLDGSLTGDKGGTALPYYKFNDWDACGKNASFDNGLVCNGTVRVRRLQLSGHAPRELDGHPISFKKSQTSWMEDSNGTEIEVDKFGHVDWQSYHEYGQLYSQECFKGNTKNKTLDNELDFSGCDDWDYSDWITYRAINGEFHGWAVPLVTHADYHADVDWHVDFQKLHMRWSEPYYFYEPYNIPLSSEKVEDPESVMIRWPYVDYRYRYRVNYAGDFNKDAEVGWFDTFSNRTDLGMPEHFSRADAFGAGEIVRQDNTLKTTACCGEWKVSMNPWEGITDVGQKAKNPLVVDVKALQCGPSMCGLPGDIPTSWPEPLYWSDPQTWVKIKNARINTADIVLTGKKPVAGESVEIPQGIYILMDEDPPALDKLVVSGKLKFDGRERHVEADRILVWGILEVGDSESAPFNGNASITLHGVRTSPTLVATDQHYLGNKNLVVFGQLRVFGKTHANRFVALNTTANKGDTTIKVQGDVSDWKVGSKIVVSGTEYPEPVDIVTDKLKLEDYRPHQQEERNITAINGNTITLDVALAYRHFAGRVSTGRGEVELRGHVGLLSSNIVIKGDLEDTPVKGQKNWYSGYGGHIVVGEVNFGSEDQLAKMKERGESLDTVRKLGSMLLSGVELRDMGKLASEHPAVLYRYFSDLAADVRPVNKISSCSFTNAWNHAVSSVKSFDIELDNNVVHKSWKNAIEIDLDSRGSVITNNLVVANQRSPDDFSEKCLRDKSCMNKQFASFMIWNQHITSLANNVAAGSEDTGFIMYPVDECGAGDDSRIQNNIAYGNLIGAFLMDSKQRTKCMQLQGFTAWKNAHIGIITVDQTANLELKNVHVADNHEGISLNFVRKGIDNHASIIDSSIIGSSPASTCDASVTCKAVSMSDVRGLKCNSEFGSKFRRVGIVMPQYTNKKKTCDSEGGGDLCDPPTTMVRICALPYENRFGNVDVQHAEFNISGTSFAYWKKDDCGSQSRAIAMNPSQPDFVPTTFMSDTSWYETTEVSKLNMGDVSYMQHEASACKSSCDAVNFFVITDTDGTAFNAYKHWDDVQQGESVSLHSEFNPAAADEDKCRVDNTTGAFFCRDYKVNRLVLESNPPRFTKRRIGPSTIAKYGDDVGDNRTYWSVGPFPQGCSCQKHFAQFTFDVQKNQNYDIFTTGVLESRNRITYASSDPNQCVLTKIFFSKPHPVKVTRASDGKAISPKKSGEIPDLDDSSDISGSNLMNPQERMLYLKMCGGENKQLWLEYENAVQVTATITMSYDEFFANNAKKREYTEQFVKNMALLLGIKPSQIKVVCVHVQGTPCTRGGGRRIRSEEAEAEGLEVFFEIAPTLTEIIDGTEVSTGDDTQAEELEAVFDLIRNNETELMRRSVLIEGDFEISGISLGDIVTSTMTTTTSITTATLTTATATSVTATSSTGTQTSTTTTGSRTTSTTSETFTSTTSITETTATQTSTTTSSTVTTATDTTATETTATATTQTETVVPLESSGSTTDQISVLAGVLAAVALIIVVTGILLVRRTKKLSSGGYAMGTYEESTAMAGSFVENATTVVNASCNNAEETETAIPEAEDDVDTEDGPGVFAFKASKFQDSLRVSKPSSISIAGIEDDETTTDSATVDANDSELIAVQHATPTPAFQLNNRLVGRTFNMEMETDDQDEADTEGVEGELPSQFFGSRAKTDHTNLELNPAMFGARSQTHEQVSVNPIQPSMLDDDDDSRPASRSGSYHETVVDEYLQVAGDDKYNDDDEC